MKAIIILILSFLLFSYSINAEEKNGAITEPVKNSEIKVLEERINGNENQIKTLKDELALKQRPMEKWYLFGAVILGAVIGFFLTEITERRRRKKDQIEKQKTLTDNIINDSLKFMFKAHDIMDNFMLKKARYLDLRKSNSSKADDLQNKFKDDLDDNLREGLYSGYSFHSLQLERLEDKEIWEKYKSIPTVHAELLHKLLKDDTLDDIIQAKERLVKLEKEFISYYLEKQSLKLWGKVTNVIPIPEESKEKKNKE